MFKNPTLKAGFKPAEVAKLPKEAVVFDQNTPDGAYIALQALPAIRDTYDQNGRKGVRKGMLIISTESGHLYSLNNAGGLAGFGKNRENSLKGLIAQRVNIEIVVSAYKAPKKVTKKKATKKRK